MTSIRWKLALASFVIVLPPIYLLNQYAIRSFDSFTSRTLEEEMISQATIVGEFYRAALLDSGDVDASFQDLLVDIGKVVQSRMQIVSPQGVVLFDSSTPSRTGEDLSERKEIASAMAGRYDAEWELTPDRSHVYYYVPLPILEHDRVVGIAYVTHHTGQIVKAIKQMQTDQRAALMWAVAFALGVSLAMAQTVTYRLRALKKSAMEIASGAAPSQDLRIRGRDEIAELARSVNHMATEVERRSDYNRDLISTVMHELKTPITAIKGAVEVLQEGAADDVAARGRFLSNIRYEADRLMQFAGELNELTRLDTENLRGQRERVDYGRCVRDIVDRLIPTFDQEHASLDVQVPDDRIEVNIATGRIEQVISNMLENAFRYTSRDGQVELRVELNEGHVKTTLSDDGPGIPPVHAERVFERFYTTEPKGVPKDYGSGLGLAIARSIVENHGGRIWVEPKNGPGARITFSLPLTGEI